MQATDKDIFESAMELEIAKKRKLTKELEYRELLREELAAYMHKAWSGWMKYMFSKTFFVERFAAIPNDLEERWTRQMQIEYKNLPESEKEANRQEADKLIKIIGEKIG